MHSLQSHTAIHGSPTTRKPPSTPSQRLSGATRIVVSFSGGSSILAELCMCTDYSSSPVTIPLFTGQLVVLSGVNFLSDSGALRCLRCKLKRPYRLTSLNTA